MHQHMHARTRAQVRFALGGQSDALAARCEALASRLAEVEVERARLWDEAQVRVCQGFP
jgi:hypothetical protein